MLGFLDPVAFVHLLRALQNTAVREYEQNFCRYMHDQKIIHIQIQQHYDAYSLPWLRSLPVKVFIWSPRKFLRLAVLIEAAQVAVDVVVLAET